jgi:hypothetical protein
MRRKDVETLPLRWTRSSNDKLFTAATATMPFFLLASTRWKEMANGERIVNG